MSYRHLIDLNSYTNEEIEKIIDYAKEIKENEGFYAAACRGKIMATLFFEPSTRTRMSFTAAMLKLGGQTMGFDNPQSSSVSKGESLKDTIKVVSSYADIIVMRHPLEGSAKAASLYADCPVINAGDGGHLHPTQTLTDLATLKFEKDRIDNLTVGLCGDLKNGRTVHSLVKTMTRYPSNRFVLISTPQLKAPPYVEQLMRNSGCEFRYASTLQECIGELDVLYMTRIQKERFSSEEEYLSQKSAFILDRDKMALAKPDMAVLHPLPRVDEIDYEVDDDCRALYFKQALYGMYVRMALVMHMLRDGKASPEKRGYVSEGERCKNPRCISHTEGYLPNLKQGRNACAYCEHKGISK